MFAPYINEIPIAEIMLGFQIKSDPARQPELGQCYHTLAVYGSSQALQAKYGKPHVARETFGAAPVTEDTIIAAQGLLDHLEAEPSGPFGASEADAALSPVVTAMLLEFAKVALQSFLSKWLKK